MTQGMGGRGAVCGGVLRGGGLDSGLQAGGGGAPAHPASRTTKPAFRRRPLGLGRLENRPPGWALPTAAVLWVLPGLMGGRGQHPDELGLVPWAALGRVRSSWEHPKECRGLLRSMGPGLGLGDPQLLPQPVFPDPPGGTCPVCPCVVEALGQHKAGQRRLPSG